MKKQGRISISVKVSHLIIAAASFVVLGTAMNVYAGNPVEPDGAPGSTSWYTLEDLYNRLTKGTAGAPSLAFDEPVGAPGSAVATMHTINEIMAKAPMLDNDNGALPSDVRSGKSFWGLRSGNWGLISGTMPNLALAQTGQKQCATDAVDTTLTACPAADYPGQDGDKLKGVASPNPRFTESNGTVTDNLTGLIWLKNANCLGTKYTEFDKDGDAGDGKVSWQRALQFVANINANGADVKDKCYAVAGHPIEWRLPNVRELQSLIDYGQANPALPNNGADFSNVQLNEYWSSTTYTPFPPKAWTVFLPDGGLRSTYKKDIYNYVWLVGNLTTRSQPLP